MFHRRVHKINITILELNGDVPSADLITNLHTDLFDMRMWTCNVVGTTPDKHTASTYKHISETCHPTGALMRSYRLEDAIVISAEYVY